MKERGWIEPIVERVVGQVLESHALQLRSEIVRRVMEEVAAQPVDEPAGETTASDAIQCADTRSPAELARAVAEIQLGSSQREILRALLDTSARYADRVALFVVKGRHAAGWQGRGFANNDAVKDFALDESAHAIAHAIGERVVACAPVSDMDARFLQAVDMPASGEAMILPLILKDKVAALLYADGGNVGGGLLDAGSLELLVLATGAWLEVNSLRKQAQKEPGASHAASQSIQAPEATPYQAPMPVAPAFNDPFASHAPAFSSGHAKAAAAAAGESSAAAASAPNERSAMVSQSTSAEVQSAAVEIDPALAEPLPVGYSETAAAYEAIASTATASLTPEDQEIHRKAQRFARLLVDEIKLYNQAKVADGRKNRDLYNGLKEVIEKSRATYQKRYGNTVAGSGNYFQHEIIRSLAEDDPSIMGANFRQ